MQQPLAFVVVYSTGRFDDGEAMSLALAGARNLALATDDRKARLLVTRENIMVDLHSTVSLLQIWEKTVMFLEQI